MFFIAFNYYCYIYIKRTRYFILICFPPFTSFCLLFISPFCVCSRNPWAASKPPPPHLFSTAFCFLALCPLHQTLGQLWALHADESPTLMGPILMGWHGEQPQSHSEPIGAAQLLPCPHSLAHGCAPKGSCSLFATR